MKDYKIVLAESFILKVAIESLEETIKEQFQFGWKVQGGISIMQDEIGTYKVSQAMIKE